MTDTIEFYIWDFKIFNIYKYLYMICSMTEKNQASYFSEILRI